MMKMFLLVVCLAGLGVTSGCVVREGRHRREVVEPIVAIPVPVPVLVPVGRR